MGEQTSPPAANTTGRRAGSRESVTAAGRGPGPGGQEEQPARRRNGPPARRVWRLGAPALYGLVVLIVIIGSGLTAGAVAPAQRPGGPPLVRDATPATAMDLSAQRANNSPTLLADPHDGRFVVLANRLDAPDFGCALQVSGDGGKSWAPARPVPELPPGAEKCYAPEVAFDGDGVLYYLFVGLAGAGNEPVGAFLTRSGDRGRSFDRPRRVLGPRNFAVRMAIDPGAGRRGRIHLVWLHARSDPPLGGFPTGPNPVLAAHSDDGGKSFSRPVQVSDPRRQRVVAPALALGPGKRVHVAYYDLGDDARDYQGLDGPPWDGTWSIVLATSRDGGRSFGPGVVVDASIRTADRVMLIFTMPPPSLVASGALVCVAWTDARLGDLDALARCSPDGGRRWRAMRRLNDDRPGTGLRQYLPRLSLAPGGRLDAVFLDRREDPRNARYKVSYTYSTDGGRRFARNLTLTPVSSNSLIGQRYVGPAAVGQVEGGSRLGLLSGPRSVIAAWPDTSNSAPGSAQDVFTGQVAFPAGSRPGWARPIGLAMVAAGAGSLLALLARRRRTRATHVEAPAA